MSVHHFNNRKFSDTKTIILKIINHFPEAGSLFSSCVFFGRYESIFHCSCTFFSRYESIINFLFTYGPCANSLSFLHLSVSLKFHGRKNSEGPSASISLLMRLMYSFMAGEAVRSLHRSIVASNGRWGSLAKISSRSSTVLCNTAGSNPCNFNTAYKKVWIRICMGVLTSCFQSYMFL